MDRSYSFSTPGTIPYLTGVYVAVNGIDDAYLVVDGPNCVFFRIPQLQPNHDWLADLARSSGLHRVVDTDATPSRVACSSSRHTQHSSLRPQRSSSTDRIKLLNRHGPCIDEFLGQGPDCLLFFRRG